MIDGQHPVQIGLFPMDIKCHTPQQLRQLQEQQQQHPHPHHHHHHHHHHHQSRLLMNGNAGMLTTSTAAATTITTQASAPAPAPTPIPTSTASAAASAAAAIAVLNGRNGKCGYPTSTPMTTSFASETTTIPTQRIAATTTATATAISTQTPATAAATSTTTNCIDPLTAVVNGSCSTNNNNNNNSNSNSNTNDTTIVSVNGDGLGLGPGPPPQQQQQQQQPPPPASSATLQHNTPTATIKATAPTTTTTATTTPTPQTMSGGISTSQQALHPARTNANMSSVSTTVNTPTSVSVCAGLLDGECNPNSITDLGCGPHCITSEQNANAPLTLQHQHQQQQHQQQQQRIQMHMGNNGTAMAPHHHQHQHHHHHHNHNHYLQQSCHHAQPNHHPLPLNSTVNGNAGHCNTMAVGDVLSSLQIRLPCGASSRLRGLNIDNGATQCNNIGNGNGNGIGVGISVGVGVGVNIGMGYPSHIGVSGSLAIAQCGYCCQPICDRYIMRVVDTSFHESCLKCATCSLHLVHSCFARDGKLYCRIDYERIFMRNQCLGCGHKIASDELVMRALENVFHLKCFACVVCGSLLKKGEQYVVKQGQLFCRFDYEKEVEMLQGYDFYGDDLFPPKLDGRRGPKRPRTILNTQQRRAFKASFEVSPKPCRKVRENLAKETGLSLRIVQVWFQNQRAKVKKIQKKAKQEHPKGNSDSQDSQESDSSLAKIKDEAPSDNESLLESPYFACGTSGTHAAGNNAETMSENLGKLRCIKDENENAPFNCMETDKENCNKNNEPILNTILGLSYATFQQLMGPFTQSPMVNPIDRLYSMQNSYFRPEELNFNDCGKELTEN